MTCFVVLSQTVLHTRPPRVALTVFPMTKRILLELNIRESLEIGAHELASSPGSRLEKLYEGGGSGNEATYELQLPVEAHVIW